MVSTSTNDKPKLYILYGSQTGQAETIANEIYEEGVFKSQNVSLYCLKDFGKEFNILEIEFAIFVCSTTGDGDPPENARKFIRSISQKTLPKNHLSHLHYTLLGLGDSNYSTFCGGPKRLEKSLKQNGAKSFYKTSFADDGTDMEIEVEPWLDGLWEAVDNHYKIVLSSKSKIDDKEQNVDLDGENEKQGNILNNDKLGVSNSNPKMTNMKTNLTQTSGSDLLINDVSENVKSLKLVPKIDTNLINVNHFQDTTLSKTVTEIQTQMQASLVTKPLLLYSTELTDVDLTPPPLGKIHLKLHFNDSDKRVETSYQNDAKFPLATGPAMLADIVNAKQLTADDAVKRALEIEIKSENGFEYQPGDSFGICTKNSDAEVEWLIRRLNLEEIADKTANLSLLETNSKKKTTLPNYIPDYFTIREIFTTCVEIRSVPKKPLIRLLVECTSDPTEKRRLLELCSRQGANEYTNYIRVPGICILDILALFPSCLPDCATIIQHLPRLQPRRYSLISSPLESSLKFVFNVVRFEIENGRTFKRNGVCTGQLENSVNPILDGSQNFKTENLRIFPILSTGFCLPQDPTTPIVTIGPGTGVAPFLGFLNHRKLLKKSNPDLKFGESLLFFGCRHKDRDYLYKNELQSFIVDQILTKLFVSFSRDVSVSPNQAKYVQDNLRQHSSEVVQLLLNKNAVFYVCGDARNMAKDVRNCLLKIIADETNCDDVTALEKFKKVVDEKRYKEDIWS